MFALLYELLKYIDMYPKILSELRPYFNFSDTIPIATGLLTYYGTALLALITIYQNTIIGKLQKKQARIEQIKLYEDRKPKLIIKNCTLKGANYDVNSAYCTLNINNDEISDPPPIFENSNGIFTIKYDINKSNNLLYYLEICLQVKDADVDKIIVKNMFQNNQNIKFKWKYKRDKDAIKYIPIDEIEGVGNFKSYIQRGLSVDSEFKCYYIILDNANVKYHISISLQNNYGNKYIQNLEIISTCKRNNFEINTHIDGFSSMFGDDFQDTVVYVDHDF